MPKAWSNDPLASTMDATRPRTMTEKYSAPPKLKAISARGGANSAMMMVAIVPAMNEPMAETASASPA